ncbi:hypothetical protein [Halobacterium rubrum]|uniref:hypothetical protein n=1 Tax=Halobacterium TaxID=2239 RepID=UPI001F15B838|nr:MULTISPECIES: hypothetical protein [Halobacterium]MDH5019337.1 hypothetical protein [Halobacterium rubrum]
MATAGVAFGLFLVVGVGGALLLYLLVRREAEDTTRMTREEAHEQVSREQDE